MTIKGPFYGGHKLIYAIFGNQPANVIEKDLESQQVALADGEKVTDKRANQFTEREYTIVNGDGTAVKQVNTLYDREGTKKTTHIRDLSTGSVDIWKQEAGQKGELSANDATFEEKEIRKIFNKPLEIATAEGDKSQFERIQELTQFERKRRRDEAELNADVPKWAAPDPILLKAKNDELRRSIEETKQDIKTARKSLNMDTSWAVLNSRPPAEVLADPHATRSELAISEDEALRSRSWWQSLLNQNPLADGLHDRIKAMDEDLGAEANNEKVDLTSSKASNITVAPTTVGKAASDNPDPTSDNAPRPSESTATGGTSITQEAVSNTPKSSPNPVVAPTAAGGLANTVSVAVAGAGSKIQEKFTQVKEVVETTIAQHTPEPIKQAGGKIKELAGDAMAAATGLTNKATNFFAKLNPLGKKDDVQTT